MARLQDVLDQIDADAKGVVVPIFKRNGKPYLNRDGSQVTITGFGSESEEYKRRRTEYYRKAAESGAELDEATARREVAALMVTEWTWENEASDGPLPVSLATAAELFRGEHVLFQFEQGIARRTDFFSAGSGA